MDIVEDSNGAKAKMVMAVSECKGDVKIFSLVWKKWWLMSLSSDTNKSYETQMLEVIACIVCNADCTYCK